MNEGDNRAAVSAADMEQDTSNAPLGKEETPRFDSLVNVKVISYRKRNTDPDGVSVKAVLDGITRAGILPDDSSKQIKTISFENRKAKVEKTVIEIELA